MDLFSQLEKALDKLYRRAESFKQKVENDFEQKK